MYIVGVLEMSVFSPAAGGGGGGGGGFASINKSPCSKNVLNFKES